MYILVIQPRSYGYYAQHTTQTERHRSRVTIHHLPFNDQDVIGSIKIKSDSYGVGEIGIFIGDANYWNRGIASESISIISQWAESQKDFRKLSAGSYSINQGSIKAFVKNGFQIEGNREEHVRDDSFGTIDLVLLGKILSDPKNRKSVEKSI